MIRALNCAFFVLFFSTARSEPNGNEKLMSPYEARNHEFPYTASLRLNGKHFCGGAIISNRYILTAATCFRYLPEIIYPSTVTVVTGTNYLNRGGETHEILEYFIHPEYKESIEKVGAVWNFDIAVVKLRNSIQFNDYQQKIDLPKRRPAVNKSAVVSTWRSPKFESVSKSNTLQTVTLKIMTKKSCQKYFNFLDISPSVVCGIREKTVYSCSGDLGSPLVYKSQVIGVALSGEVCEVPDIFTNVYNFIDQINEWMS